MIVSNPTHYYNDNSRSFNSFPDSCSWEFESSKRNGYLQRLYYEYLYTKSVHGITLYYTLTHNNKSVCKYFSPSVGSSFNVFDYSAIRYITNGALVKKLEREYNCRMQYFCACEAGEGKGTRGKGNNPHYHFIFSLQPLHDEDGNPIFEGFRCPTPFEFRSMIREAWLGSDAPYVNYRTAKYGIVKEGENMGEVISSDAFSYVTKYVIKDQYTRQFLDCYRVDSEKRAYSQLYSIQSLFAYYKYLRDYNQWNKDYFLTTFRVADYNYNRHSHTNISVRDWLNNVCFEGHTLAHDYLKWFESVYVPDVARKDYNQFYNAHGPKVRISNGYGSFGLQFIKHTELKDLITVPTAKGLKDYSPCLYYVRKMYFNIKKCPVTGNPLYYLNSAGIEYKLRLFGQSVLSHMNRTRDQLNAFCNASLSYSDYQARQKVMDYSSLLFSDEWLEKYSIYSIVYKYRSFSPTCPLAIEDGYTPENIISDYRQFLQDSPFTLDRCSRSLCLDRYANRDSLSVNCLPCFASNLYLFNLVDYCCETINSYVSDKKKEAFEKNKVLHSKFSVLAVNQS